MNVLVSLDLSSHVHMKRITVQRITYLFSRTFSFALLDIHFGNDTAAIALLVKNYQNRHLYFQHDSDYILTWLYFNAR